MKGRGCFWKPWLSELLSFVFVCSLCFCCMEVFLIELLYGTIDVCYDLPFDEWWVCVSFRVKICWLGMEQELYVALWHFYLLLILLLFLLLHFNGLHGSNILVFWPQGKITELSNITSNKEGFLKGTVRWRPWLKRVGCQEVSQRLVTVSDMGLVFIFLCSKFSEVQCNLVALARICMSFSRVPICKNSEKRR